MDKGDAWTQHVTSMTKDLKPKVESETLDCNNPKQSGGSADVLKNTAKKKQNMWQVEIVIIVDDVYPDKKNCSHSKKQTSEV